LKVRARVERHVPSHPQNGRELGASADASPIVRSGHLLPATANAWISREARALEAMHSCRSQMMILGVAYDEDLANRIRELIAAEPDVSEQSMFGGLVFLVGGHMSVAVGAQGSLVVRVDPEDTDEFLAKPHAQPFVMGGRQVEGRVRVDAEGVRTRRQLERWVKLSVGYARSLPPKR
jgi:TfoX/Sxy family transcriptional regulator of competence genes